MTTSRSFAPLDAEGNPLPPVFPMLPFAFLAYAERCTREYAGQAERMVHTDELWGAEDAALGLKMLGEMNQAFLQMMWAPFGQTLGAPRD
jgi:hypothetical protein